MHRTSEWLAPPSLRDALSPSEAKTWRAAAQPQKGRSASGALVTAVSKSVHERASERRETRVSDAYFGGRRFAIGRKRAGRAGRRKSRGVIEPDRERVQKEKDRSESERVSSALVAPGHRPRCSEPLQAGFGPRTRSDGTAIFPNCGHAPANENATSRRERRAYARVPRDAPSFITAAYFHTYEYPGF